MAEAFDPYHKWLGIPPEDQPPDHYRLLGLKALESDRDAIESAADQRMAHLRTYQSGKQSGLSQAILNEVAAAKICLLNPAKKAAYDEQLRKKLGAPATAVVEAPAGFNLDDLLGQPASGPVHHSHPKTAVAKGPSKQVWILAGAGATAGLLLLIVVVAVLFSGDRKEPAQSPKAVASPQPIVPSPSQPSPQLPASAAQPPEVTAQPKVTVTIASPPFEDVKPGVTVSPVARPQPKTVAATVAGSQTINLLALVDPARDAVVGEWEVQQSGLAIVRQSFCALIRIPVIPAGSFEFETEFTRSQGDGCVALLVPAGNSFVHVEVSGYHGRFSGMGCINSFSTNNSHNPTSRPSSISSNVRHKLAVRVDASANNQVTINETFDGSELFRWQGAVSALSGVPFWRMSRPATLGLGADGAVVVFHTARLRMLDGQAKSPNGQPLVAIGASDAKVERPQPAAIGPSVSPPGEKTARVPVPAAAVQKESLATLQEIYHFERVTTPAAQVKLAKEMLQLAENSKGKPDEQFAVLRKVAELACDAGDADLMLQAADSIAATFELDAIAMKDKLLARLAEGAKDATRIKGFVRAADRIISQDLAEDRYEAAEAVSALAERIAQKPLGKSFRKEVHDRHLQIQQLHKEWQPVQAALETLKSHPDDADASLAVGRWHCLNKGDWEKGLPCLAKGGDSELCQAAQADVKSPEGAAAQLKLADAWWDLAAKAHGAEQEALRLRAGYWYKQLLGEVNGGLVRLKIQKRLDQIEQIGRPLPGVPPGKWKRAVVNSIGMKLVLIPPGEFMMGSPDSDRAAKPDEKPQHRVRITRPFYM